MLLPASPSCSSSAVCASPSLSVLPCTIHCFLIAASSSSSSSIPSSSSSHIMVCLLPSFPLWCSGANRDCIETGRRNWLPSLCSWNTGAGFLEQSWTGNVFLQLLRAAGASLAMSWHTGVGWVCRQRGPEKLARVQWRLNPQRTGLPYFTELCWACATIFPLFHSPVPWPNLNVFPWA